MFWQLLQYLEKENDTKETSVALVSPVPISVPPNDSVLF